jgi:hypothetical protein
VWDLNDAGQIVGGGKLGCESHACIATRIAEE